MSLAQDDTSADEVDDPCGTSARSIRELLSDRVFSPFFSNALSNTANWFQNVAAGIVVYDLSGSNTAVGAVSIPVHCDDAVHASRRALTDRVHRKWMLFTGQFVAFLGALGLAITVALVGMDRLPGPWPVDAATGVIGIGAAIILPPQRAIVPSVVAPTISTGPSRSTQ